MRKGIYMAGLLLFVALASSCSQRTKPLPANTPLDNRAADAAAIRTTDADWVKAVQAKDVTKLVSFYANDASVLPPGGPITTGRKAITNAWRQMVAEPGFALMFTPSKIEVARSGDMAYELGDYALTVNNRHGQPETTKGKYVVVWTKQPGGNWKVAVDAPTTTH